MKTELHFRFLLTMIYVIGISMVLMSTFLSNAFAQNNTTTAETTFQSGSLTLPPNVKQLFILIPNEGHHGPGEDNEARFIAQPFVPQNAVISPGTEVVWFSGDVGHEHNIVVKDPNGIQLFETGEFTELTASRPIVFNNTGDFEYEDTVEYEGGFVMTGTIRVVDQNASSSPPGTFDTVGALMIPSMDVQNIVASIKDAGFGIDSMHNFKDLRGGQSDTGDEQTLVILTASGMDLNEVASKLQAISEPLPYE
jgi:plastocyanin